MIMKTLKIYISLDNNVFVNIFLNCRKLRPKRNLGPTLYILYNVLFTSYIIIHYYEQIHKNRWILLDTKRGIKSIKYAKYNSIFEFLFLNKLYYIRRILKRI